MKKSVILTGILVVFLNCGQKKKSNLENTAAFQHTATPTDGQGEIVPRAIDTVLPAKADRTLEDYQKNIELFEEKITSKKTIATKDVESVIPINFKEFLYFYELTYSDDENQILFDNINLEIFKFATEDRGNTFFLCLDMAQFVDGEYADSYFGDIEEVVMNNKKKFCSMFKHLSKNTKWRIEDLYKEVCKGIKRPDEDW